MKDTKNIIQLIKIMAVAFKIKLAVYKTMIGVSKNIFQ